MDLRRYLDARNIPVAVFAETLGVSVQAVHRYLSGERLPRPDVMMRIKQATHGAVRPNDFYSCRETEAAE